MPKTQMYPARVAIKCQIKHVVSCFHWMFVRPPWWPCHCCCMQCMKSRCGVSILLSYVLTVTNPGISRVRMPQKRSCTWFPWYIHPYCQWLSFQDVNLVYGTYVHRLVKGCLVGPVNHVSVSTYSRHKSPCVCTSFVWVALLFRCTASLQLL